MSIEKKYHDFIRIHEKKKMTTDIKSLQENITNTTGRAIEVIGGSSEKELKEAVDKLNEGLGILQKVLIKYDMFELI